MCSAGLAAGAAEMLFEKVSVDRLVDLTDMMGSRRYKTADAETRAKLIAKSYEYTRQRSSWRTGRG